MWILLNICIYLASFISESLATQKHDYLFSLDQESRRAIDNKPVVCEHKVHMNKENLAAALVPRHPLEQKQCDLIEYFYTGHYTETFPATRGKLRPKLLWIGTFDQGNLPEDVALQTLYALSKEYIYFRIKQFASGVKDRTIIDVTPEPDEIALKQYKKTRESISFEKYISDEYKALKERAKPTLQHVVRILSHEQWVSSPFYSVFTDAKAFQKKWHLRARKKANQWQQLNPEAKKMHTLTSLVYQTLRDKEVLCFDPLLADNTDAMEWRYLVGKKCAEFQTAGPVPITPEHLKHAQAWRDFIQVKMLETLNKNHSIELQSLLREYFEAKHKRLESRVELLGQNQFPQCGVYGRLDTSAEKALYAYQKYMFYVVLKQFFFEREFSDKRSAIIGSLQVKSNYWLQRAQFDAELQRYNMFASPELRYLYSCTKILTGRMR